MQMPQSIQCFSSYSSLCKKSNIKMPTRLASFFEGTQKVSCLFMNSWDSDVVGDHNQLTTNSLEKLRVSAKRRYIQDNKNKL